MVAIQLKKIIKVLSAYPKTWKNTLNYRHTDNAELRYSDGWRDVIQPTLNVNTQVKGDIYFDEENDIFTYFVIDLTEEQIADLLAANDKNEAREKIGKYRNSGIGLIERTRSKMWRRLHKFPDGLNSLTKPQIAKLERWFNNVYLWLLVGNYRQAKNDIDSVITDRGSEGNDTLNETAGMLDTALWLQEEINDYFDNQYDM